VLAIARGKVVFVVKLFVLVVLVVALLSFVKSDPSVCHVTQLPPASGAYTLETCGDYQDNACCSVGHDFDIGNDFQTLMSLGDSCPYALVSDSYIAKWFCAGCDPNQPDYVYQAADQLANATSMFLVCQSFADNVWGDGTKYDGCGLRLADGNVHIPSVMFNNASSFINTVMPPYLDDGSFTFVIVEESSVEQIYGSGVRCFGGSSGASVAFFSVSLILMSVLLSIL